MIAFRRAVPDVTELADYLLSEHRTLLELAQAQEEAAPQGGKVAASKTVGALKRTTAKTAATVKPAKRDRSVSGHQPDQRVKAGTVDKALVARQGGTRKATPFGRSKLFQ